LLLWGWTRRQRIEIDEERLVLAFQALDTESKGYGPT